MKTLNSNEVAVLVAALSIAAIQYREDAKTSASDLMDDETLTLGKVRVMQQFDRQADAVELLIAKIEGGGEIRLVA